MIFSIIFKLFLNFYAQLARDDEYRVLQRHFFIMAEISR